MKKRLIIISLIFIFVCTSAMTQDLKDVPQGHWSYDAVMQLARKGLVEGYPEGVFKGERNATRYEMAMIVARVVAKLEQNKSELETLDAQTKETIDKLMAEYRTELDSLNVKIKKIEDIQAKQAEKITKLENFTWSVDNHSVNAVNRLSGNGASSATTYDMSFFEWGLGGNLVAAGGSMVTSNAAYPIAGSSAFTTNTKVSFKGKLEENIDTGATIELYTASDTDNNPPAAGSARRWRTAQVFGVEQPGGIGYNALLPEAVAGNRIQPSFVANLYDVFVSQQKPNSNWKVQYGSTDPAMIKDSINEVKLDHFFLRDPLSSMSLFGHQVRTDQAFGLFYPQPREPMRNLQIAGKSGDIFYNVFTGYVDETPRSSNTTYNLAGGRTSYKKNNFGIGAGAYRAKMQNPRTADPNRNVSTEKLYEVDASYKFNNVTLFGALAASAYVENGLRIGSSYNGTNTAVGFKADDLIYKGLTLKAQYQSCSENYEPLGIHKPETYPRNYQGITAELGYKLSNKKGSAKLLYYNLEQVNADLNTTRNSTTNAANDLFFPATAAVNTVKGKVKILSPEFIYNFDDKNSLAGYYELISISRAQDSAGTAYYKKGGNLSLWCQHTFNKNLSGILGFRNVNFTGSWSNINLNHTMTIPKVGLTYKVTDNITGTLLYNAYTFEDKSSNIAVEGQNDWMNSQFLIYLKIKF